jgi:hypothetical protein
MVGDSNCSMHINYQPRDLCEVAGASFCIERVGAVVSVALLWVNWVESPINRCRKRAVDFSSGRTVSLVHEPNPGLLEYMDVS